MKNILILGAGQSAPYLIKYLFDNSEENDWFLNICDRDYELAKMRVDGNSRGNAIEFDVNDAKMRNKLIEDSDIVINFLAPVFQYMIALDCLRFRKPMITASYENPRVKELHKDALREGILILNEMGLDPGIDHMSAMKIIERIRSRNGIITSFISYGAGLPAPEVNSNPMRYIITWNPRNVAMAGEAGAQFLSDNKIKILSHNQVFNRTWEVNVEGVGILEAYPNRDSLSYIDVFNFKKLHTMIRGTLRYPGWSETWSQIVKLGIPNENATLYNIGNYTFAQFTEMFIPRSLNGSDIRQRVASFLGISPTGKIMQNLEWLGLFSDEKIGFNYTNPAEVLTSLLKQKMPIPKDARDMVVLIHELIAEFPTGEKEKITSTFIEYGEPGGYTAIAKTVGLPAAISAKLYLQDKLPITGCQIPTHPIIYNSILDELINLGFIFNEKIEKLN